MPGKKPVPAVISASRRTDIPAFYMPWFMQRLQAGHVSYPNPYNRQTYQVSLRPEDVHSIVFWSKHFGPFLPYIDELEDRGYNFLCHYTITGAGRELEPHVPDWRYQVDVMQQLAERIGPRRVLWRFDPIIFTESIGPADYAEQFRTMAELLAGSTERCYFSFATFYGKVARNMKQSGLRPIDPPDYVKKRLVNALADIAEANGITMHACCQDGLVDDRVQQAHCIDKDLLSDLFPEKVLKARKQPTRDGCGCVASRDIGMYDSCVHGCLYCYANMNHNKAVANRRLHDPHADMLLPMITEKSA